MLALMLQDKEFIQQLTAGQFELWLQLIFA